MPRFTDPKGQRRPSTKATRESAAKAEGMRRSVEGLTGIGAGRKSSSFTAKRVGRILLAFVLIAVFCCAVYFVAWQTEFIGGKTVPDVVGWHNERAVAELTEVGFTNIETTTQETDEIQEGMVVSTNPEAGLRVETDTLITVTVATPLPAEQVTSES